MRGGWRQVRPVVGKDSSVIGLRGLFNSVAGLLSTESALPHSLWSVETIARGTHVLPQESLD